MVIANRYVIFVLQMTKDMFRLSLSKSCPTFLVHDVITECDSHRICDISNTTGATDVVGVYHTFGAHKYPCFWRGLCSSILSFLWCFVGHFVCPLLCQCIVYPRVYDF